ncbi:MAG: paraquat-inducible protein A [Pseudomonadota bacterium]
MNLSVPLWLALSNALLLLLFPLAWVAPLLRAGLLPLFGLSEITIFSGIVSLWTEAPALALLIALFALIAPIAKVLALGAVHLSLAGTSLAHWTEGLARLAMADVFLVALYVVVVKGVGFGRVEVAWGLWLFTACVLLSLAASLYTKRLIPANAP